MSVEPPSSDPPTGPPSGPLSGRPSRPGRSGADLTRPNGRRPSGPPPGDASGGEASGGGTSGGGPSGGGGDGTGTGAPSGPGGGSHGPGGPDPGHPWWKSAPRIALLSGVVVAAVILGLVFTRPNGTATRGEVFLQPASEAGPDPFTESTARESSTVPQTPAAGAPESAHVTRGVDGGADGLYAGTRNAASCDVEKQVKALQADPAKNRAFASAEGIKPAAVPGYLRSLTSVQLRMDTRVTAHRYVKGAATDYQAVLQAGTAVMVDGRGVPRLRCACGNPLLPPVAQRTEPRRTGGSWPSFRSQHVVVVAPARSPVKVFVIYDAHHDEWVARHQGDTAGHHDKKTHAPAKPPEPSLTITPPPSSKSSEPPSSEKSSKEPSDKSSKDASEEPSDKPSKKPSDKSPDKSSEKPSKEPSDKSSKESSKKPSDKSSDKSSEKPSEKPSEPSSPQKPKPSQAPSSKTPPSKPPSAPPPPSSGPGTTAPPPATRPEPTVSGPGSSVSSGLPSSGVATTGTGAATGTTATADVSSRFGGQDQAAGSSGSRAV